jgi:hypothetical protein
MRTPFRFAAVIIAITIVSGLAKAQAIAPPGSGVIISKQVIDNGLSHTVKYFVTGASPRLQALVRRVEWAENELSVVEQLQLLKLDTVVNERSVAAFRTAQLTNPYFPPGYTSLSTAADNWGESPLQRSLAGQLAHEATPEAAQQMIGFLEKMQTELDAELKALPPQEKKAAQGPIDALRPRLAALPHGNAPPPRPQPVASQQVAFPARAVSQRPPMPPNSDALQQTVRQFQETMRQQLLQTQQQILQRQ